MTFSDPLPAAAPPVLDWPLLLALHEPWVRRVILARTGELQAVDEVWQQVALAAIEQRWPLTDATKAGPWLHRLAVIASARFVRQLGRHRRAARRLAEGSPSDASGMLDPLLWLLRAERIELTRQAIRQLDGRDAEVLLLKYADRWSYRQIAEHLGITDKAVDCRLLRARARLREALAARGITENES
jgi:RNA polymerase sigma-70 factor (ECF subfamily)